MNIVCVASRLFSSMSFKTQEQRERGTAEQTTE